MSEATKQYHCNRSTCNDGIMPVEAISFDSFASIPWLRHGFSHRMMGDMGTSPERFAREGIPPRLAEALGDLGMDASRAALAQQVHQDRVGVARVGDDAPSLRGFTDALITQDVGIPLVTFGADCPNVFFADMKKKAIGLAHSGRLGTIARIVPKIIEAMEREFGTMPADLRVLISPSIGGCCYPTDLWTMLENQLRECGVRDFVNARQCTYCHADLYYSYRKSKDSCGRMMAAMMIAKRDTPE